MSARRARLAHRNLAAERPDGESLAQRLASGPLAPVAVRDLAQDLLSGLGHAHAHGVVHGRLTSADIVAVWDCWVVTGFDAVPSGGERDERNDVRAVGAVLYEAATGRPPGTGEPLSLPRELRAPILRSLHELPERRYGTIGEMARALGVAGAKTTRRPRLTWWPLVAIAAGLAMGGVTRVAVRPNATAALAPIAASPAAPEPPAPPAPPPRRVIAVEPFTAPPDAAWIGVAVADMLATVLGENPGLEVVRAGAGEWRVGGAIEAVTGGWVVVVRVVDPATNATLAATRETVAGRPALIGRIGAIAARLSSGLAAGVAPPILPALTTGSIDAYQAYLEGTETSLRRAMAIDPTFVQPRLRLAAWLRDHGRDDEARALLATVRPLVGRAGVAAALALRRLEARTPAELLAVLLAEQSRAPHDSGLAAELAASYRRLGQAADCAAEAERAGALAGRDLAWCRVALGDGPGALAAARLSEDPVLIGDIALMLGRFGEARESYRKAGAAARLALVALRAQGRCRLPVHIVTTDDARIAAALAIACGDWDVARAAETAARRLEPRAGDELAVLIGAARGDGKSYARARTRAADAALWAADGLDRGRRLGPLLAAGRSEKQPSVLDGFAPAPSDRWGLFEEPLLYEVALTQAEFGDAEAAALACTELAETGAIIAHYCRGRAAESASDWGGAFLAYREFLDRWSDADKDERLILDAQRRIRQVVMKARAK